MLPLVVALILLVVRRDWTQGMLRLARGWLDRHLRTVVAVLGFLLALSLLRDAIVGLVECARRRRRYARLSASSCGDSSVGGWASAPSAESLATRPFPASFAR